MLADPVQVPFGCGSVEFAPIMEEDTLSKVEEDAFSIFFNTPLGSKPRKEFDGRCPGINPGGEETVVHPSHAGPVLADPVDIEGWRSHPPRDPPDAASLHSLCRFGLDMPPT